MSLFKPFCIYLVCITTFGIAPSIAQSMSDLSKADRGLIDYLLNLSVEIKGNSNRDVISIIQSDQYPCAFLDVDEYQKSDNLYLATFNSELQKAKTKFTFIDRDIIEDENVGKVKYFRFPSYASFSSEEITVVSQLRNTFDNSVSVHFQNFYLSSQSATGVILPRSKSFKYKLNDLAPISNFIGYQLVAATRLLNGNLSMIVKYDYETLSYSMFKDIGSGGLGTISRGKEIKSIYEIVILDKIGQTIIRKADYILPEKFFVRLAPNGGIVIISQIQFKPERVHNTTKESLKEYFSENKGMSVTIFDENLNIERYLPIESKKDQRIKDPRLIGVVSDRDKIFIHYASNQSGILNQETFTMSEVSFADGSIKHYTSNSILEEYKYFTYDFGFVYKDELFLVHSFVNGNPMWEERNFYRMRRINNGLELSVLKPAFINLKN
jgi:hypothetical protein